MKLGRNEKCWCGSGLKYKKCHLGREKEPSITSGEAISFSKSNSQRKSCYAPSILHGECEKRIINAHTISKSSSLISIADQTNHVMGLKINLPNLIKNKGRLYPEKIGINQASTFTGFCAYHDRTLFSCIENIIFSGTPEQCFSLMFRSLAKEIYAKEGGLRSSDFAKSADKGRTVINQIFIQKFIQDHQLGLNAAITELTILKNKLDEILISKEFSKIESLVFTFSQPLPVVVSSILSPEKDFDGNDIQDLGDLNFTPEQVCFNAFSSEGKGYVVFSWLANCNIIPSFIDSLRAIPNDNVFDALIKFFFTKAENCFFSPCWWDGLNEAQRENICNMIMSGVELFSDFSCEIDYSISYGTRSIDGVNFLQ